MPVTRFQTPLLILAGLCAVWGILSLFDVYQQPFSGYTTDGNNTIVQVTEGSPAARAGFREGDYIREVGGIAVEDAAAMARRRRARIGETRAYLVERDGETVRLDLTYGEQPSSQAALTFAAIFIGFCFLILGLLPYVKVATLRTLLLAIFGICFGLSFFGGPYFNAYALRSFMNAVTLLFVVTAFATLLHFTLLFPERKRLATRPLTLRLIYGVAGLVALFMLYRSLFQPTATSTLNMVTAILIGGFVASYFILALANVLHSYLKATPEARTAYGLNIVVAGMLAGFLPVLIGILVRLAAPQVTLPGRSYYFLTLACIPIALALAAIKRERASMPVPSPSPARVGQPNPA